MLEKDVSPLFYQAISFINRQVVLIIEGEKVEMPYEKVKELPDSVKDNLPKHAQEIYLKAYNSAWEQYKDPEDRRGDASREETAHKVAWAAVKNEYEKDDQSGDWKPKDK
jgi:cation transport regulator